MGFKGDVVQLYPNIAENVYGYIVTLLDETGDPLANKQVYCTTNANYYTTNDAGIISDVIYSTSTSPVVTFEIANQPWADGTYDLIWRVGGTSPGVIQRVSSTATRTYEGCAYTITFRNYDNSLWTNNSVYCTTNGKTYYTNASGQVSFITSQSSLSFRITSGVQNYYIDSGIRVNTQNDVIGSTTGTIGSLVSRSVTGTLQNPTIVSYNINATATVGNIITIGSRDYIIAHDDGTNVYAVLRYREEDCLFNASGSNAYAGSDIANKCTDWYNNQVPAIWKTANAFNQVITMGVTAACFIPTYNQYNGGWSYFNSNSRRVYTPSSETATTYWASTSYTTNGVWSVEIVRGNLTVTYVAYASGETSNTIGAFRPALALKRSMFLNG